MIIVYDTPVTQFSNNRVFDPPYAARFPGALALVQLHDLAAQRGWQMMTADVFLKTRPADKCVVCLSEMVSPYTEKVLAQGAIPAVIMSGESPNVAWDFYHHLSRYTVRYQHAFLFRGFRTLVPASVQFHTFCWPNAQQNVVSGQAWSERELLVMISSNKQRFQVSPGKPLPELRRIGKRLLWSYLRIANPLFRLKDLYAERWVSIRYFAQRPGFSLFGNGWNKPDGLSSQDFQIIQRLNAHAVEHKLESMSHFKFAFCFENCVFPGYITEKIFDCFFAGCVPIYYGAPDITDFVPRETFIDFQEFKSLEELERYLRQCSERDVQRYLSAAQDFLLSPEFEQFHQDTFVRNLLDIFETLDH